MEASSRRRPPIEWPGGAKICVSVTVAFEAFRYASQYSHREKGSQREDRFSLSYAEYGPNAGVWRIFDILDRQGVRATFDVGGMAAERYPHVMKEMHQRGHEAAGHGYANDIFPDEDDSEEELRVITATAKAIEASTGARPVGWVSPGSVGTAKTFQFMIQEGFIWNGDDASDDVPFIRMVDGKPLVILPRVNFPTNDLIVWIRPQNPPSAYYEGFREVFDLLYEEGRRGSPKWVDLLLHTHMGGRPALAGVFERALAYARAYDGVWFARRRDIAEWMLKRYHA
jgi:peptidoglycan/xylan/chitin deacetylase (PgdA/CDA1 family)